MLGGIRDAHVGLIGQFLDCAWRLHQKIEQLQAVRVGQGAADLGKQLVQAFFMLAAFVFRNRHLILCIQLFYRFIEYYH